MRRSPAPPGAITLAPATKKPAPPFFHPSCPKGVGAPKSCKESGTETKSAITEKQPRPPTSPVPLTSNTSPGLIPLAPADGIELVGGDDDPRTKCVDSSYNSTIVTRYRPVALT